MRDMRRQFLQLLETIGFVDRGGQVCVCVHTHTHTYTHTHTHTLILETTGFVDRGDQGSGEPHGKNSEQLMLVRGVMTAGMYPNLVSVEAGKRGTNSQKFSYILDSQCTV
jgi:hypothetical protein